ncbi:MAG: hypothetical protein K9I95_03955 [Flavobacteriaceae bacterium]|nr:hypothetical protein [Flavobacteriaceae bacterium]
MKNLLFILSFSFLVLFSCSSNSEEDNSSKDDNTFLIRTWYSNSYECNGNRDYYVFSAPNIYEHHVIASSSDCDGYILAESGTWTREGVTIVIDYDQNIETSVLTIDELSATTFSFVATGGMGGYYVLSSY